MVGLFGVNINLRNGKYYYLFKVKYKISIQIFIMLQSFDNGSIIDFDVKMDQ